MRFLFLLFYFFASAVHADVKIIIPYAAGGYADQAGRILQKALSDELKTTVTVDYKLGAGGSIATAYVNSAPQSEQLILLDGLGIASNHVNDDGSKTANIHQLAYIGSVQAVVLTSNKSNIKTYNQLIATSDKNQLSYGSAGINTTPHLFGAVIGARTDRSFIHVPFKGQSAVLPFLISGDIDFAVINRTTAMPLIEGKMATPVAVVAHTRLKEMPNVPTLSERGVKGLEHYGWFAAFTNQSMGSENYNVLSAALKIVLADPLVIDSLAKIGLTKAAGYKHNDPAFIETEKKRFTNNIKGVKLD